MNDPSFLIGLGFAVGIWLGVIGMMSAYRNGVHDGAHNQWLPRVQKILGKIKPVETRDL